MTRVEQASTLVGDSRDTAATSARRQESCADRRVGAMESSDGTTLIAAACNGLRRLPRVGGHAAREEVTRIDSNGQREIEHIRRARGWSELPNEGGGR